MVNEFSEVMTLLKESRVLKDIILIGSWAFILYREKYTHGNELMTLRTRDIDILVGSEKKKKGVNLKELFELKGFITDFRGDAGYMIFMHPELNIEFLIDLVGRDNEKPYEITDWQVNAQKIRYLSILNENTIVVQYKEYRIRIPKPAAFTLQKILILSKRKKSKRDRDIEQIKQIIVLLEKEGLNNDLKKIYKKMIPGWKRTLIGNLNKYFNRDFSDTLINKLLK